MANNTNPYITNEIIKSMKYYGNSWFTISRYFLLFPLGVSLLKARSIGMGIDALVSYPVGMVSFGSLGGMYGTAVSIKEHEKEVMPKFVEYNNAVISVLTDELHSYAKYKLDEISKKF